MLLSLALNAAAILVRPDVDGRFHEQTPVHRPSVALSTRTLSAAGHDDAPHEAAATLPPPSAEVPTLTRSDPQPSRSAEAGVSAPRTVKEAATEASPAASIAAATPTSSTSTDYAKTSDLDNAPVPLGDITPDYPSEAAFRRGHVVLEVFISDSGVVDHVDVLSATPPGIFDESARIAFLHAKFEPGRLRGVATRSRMTIEVEFRPADHPGQLPTVRY